MSPTDPLWTATVRLDSTDPLCVVSGYIQVRAPDVRQARVRVELLMHPQAKITAILREFTAEDLPPHLYTPAR